MRIPKTIYTPKSSLIFVGGLTLFVMLFAITYTPNYGISEEATSLSDMLSNSEPVAEWYRHQGLCLPICCAIVLVVTALSRMLMILLTRTARLREGEYLLWQVGEVIATGLFCNLFLSLYLHLNYFENMPPVILIYISVAIYPYAFYWLLSERMDRDLRIAEAQHTILRLRQRNDEEENGTLRFVDEKGNVKLIVSSERVICIESAGNYVTILYENAGRLTRYSLRNTLKGIEELCQSHRLVRCHRSWFINLDRVRLLRKAPDGVYAEMDAEGVSDIPVSKSYSSEVMQRFAERK